MEQELINFFIKNAIAEDLGDGDHTALATIPKEVEGKARLIIKEEGVLAGISLAVSIFKQVDERLKVDLLLRDGEKVAYEILPLL